MFTCFWMHLFSSLDVSLISAMLKNAPLDKHDRGIETYHSNPELDYSFDFGADLPFAVRREYAPREHSRVRKTNLLSDSRFSEIKATSVRR